MANNKNLKSWHDSKIAADMGSKGGKASGVARRKKATIRECMKMLRDMDVPEEKLKEMGLGVPQITETMYALKDAGFNVSTDIITIEDAVKEILGC